MLLCIYQKAELKPCLSTAQMFQPGGFHVHLWKLSTWTITLPPLGAGFTPLHYRYWLQQNRLRPRRLTVLRSNSQSSLENNGALSGRTHTHVSVTHSQHLSIKSTGTTTATTTSSTTAAENCTTLITADWTASKTSKT